MRGSSRNADGRVGRRGASRGAAIAALLLLLGLALGTAALPAASRAAVAAAPDSARAAGADSARAPADDRARAVRDTTERKVKPFFVMARSAVVPGWGQVYNRQPLKAVIVVAGEGFLTYKIFHELKLQNDAIDRIGSTVAGTPEYDAATSDELIHRNRKIDWIWWTAAAHLLQMADAYVDAHFINFDAEFGPDDRGRARAAPRLSLALQVKF